MRDLLFSVEYKGAEQMERCPRCWCCTSCSQHCGCVAGEEGEEEESSSQMELRVLGIGDSADVIEAEKFVDSFVSEEEKLFGSEVFEEDDESEGSDTNDGSMN